MSRLIKFYERYFLPIELVLSIVLAVAFAAAFEFYFGRDVLFASVDKNRANVYGAVASVCGSLLGFVISAVSVILVFGQHLQFLKDTGHYSTLFDVFFQAILWLAAATVWSFVGLGVDTAGSGRIWVLYAMAWLCILVAFRVCRCVWLLKAITAVAAKDGQKREG